MQGMGKFIQVSVSKITNIERGLTVIEKIKRVQFFAPRYIHIDENQNVQVWFCDLVLRCLLNTVRFSLLQERTICLF